MSGIGEHKWSRQTENVLRKAGWFPGRAAKPGERVWGGGGSILTSMSLFLSEFGGLKLWFPWLRLSRITLTRYEVVLENPPPVGMENTTLLHEEFNAVTSLIGDFGLVGLQPTGDCLYLIDDAGRLYECGLRIPGGPPLDLYRLGDSIQDSIENLCTGLVALKRKVKIADRLDFDRISRELGYDVKYDLKRF